MAKAASLQIYSPPKQAPLTSDAWRSWLVQVAWPIIGQGIDNSGNQGTFPQLQVGKARFTNDNAFQELLNVDQGIYVNYSSSVNNIIYGFAANVYRSAGSAFTVGAQINAYGQGNSTGDVYGLATTAVAGAFGNARNIFGYEMDIASEVGSNQDVKYGLYLVYKDRGDGAAATDEPLGSNFFNYSAEGIVFGSQARSSSGEYCGWTVGVEFLDGWCDQYTAPAWSSSGNYNAGQIVSSGGKLWKAITFSNNVTPAVGAYWVQHTPTGTSTGAVGIDFSSMSTTSMANMASAIRLRSTQYLHWEETGAVGTKFDAVAGVLRVADNAGSSVLNVNVSTGLITSAQAGVTQGAGSTALNPKVGGSGPQTAASAGWWPIVIGNSATVYIPVWQ